ncbi:MAG TPA: hypothetical protein VII61_07810 [Ktedonobacteraceae bacterium]
MSQAISGTQTRFMSQARSLQVVYTLRLALGYTVLLGSILFLLGTSWDIQWHSLIGRDRTLIPPHIIMLSGVAISGIASLVAVFIETVLVRRYPLIAQNSTRFGNALHSSLGTYIAGYAALNAAIAFPLDAYWHALYGIDVAIWAPFHIMFVMGMAIVALGAAFMLVSAANLAGDNGSHRAKRIGSLGGIVAFGTMLGLLTILLFDALGNKGILNFGDISVNVFFFLSGLAVTWTFVSAAVAIPGRWTATCVAVVYILAALVIALFVPPATTALVAAEHLTFRTSNPGVALVAFEWPLAPILGAIAIDILFRMARRKSWSFRKRLLTIAPIALIGSIPTAIYLPTFILVLFNYLGLAGLLVSLLLGLLGSLLGTWLGLRMGSSMQQIERAL